MKKGREKRENRKMKWEWRKERKVRSERRKNKRGSNDGKEGGNGRECENIEREGQEERTEIRH